MQHICDIKPNHQRIQRRRNHTLYPPRYRARSERTRQTRGRVYAFLVVARRLVKEAEGGEVGGVEDCANGCVRDEGWENLSWDETPAVAAHGVGEEADGGLTEEARDGELFGCVGGGVEGAGNLLGSL